MSEVSSDLQHDEAARPPAIEAVIFDMDGLLLDSEIYWERARREYCRSHRCEWPPENELSVKGHNSLEWAGVIEERCGLQVGREAIIAGVTERMRALYRQHLPLLPGALSAVRELATRYPLGVASSSPPAIIEYALREARILECFSAVVSSDEAGRGKPAPDVFLMAADRLGYPPVRIAVFEDSSAGIMAAKAARMFVVAVPNSHYPPGPEALSQADMVLPSLEKFRPELLE